MRFLAKGLIKLDILCNTKELDNEYYENNRKNNGSENNDEFNFNFENKDCFEDIDEERICCSTPKNKLLTSGSVNCIDITQLTAQIENLKTLKLNNQTCPDSSNNVLNSNSITDKSSREEQKLDKEINSLIEGLTQNLSKKNSSKKDLSKRQDVVNKVCLRHMRKYYSNIFKKENAKIVRSRYCNTKASEITRAIKRTFNKEFETEILPVEFYSYLIGILKIKDINTMKCSLQTKIEIADFHDCCRNYSKHKYYALFKNESLKILCRKFVSENSSNQKYQSLIHEFKQF